MLPQFRKALLLGSGLAALGLVVGLFVSAPGLWQPCALGSLVLLALALGFGAIPPLKGFAFTVWILCAVLAGLLYPNDFLHIGGFDTRNRWLILIVVQMVMFGMGTQMSLEDFRGVAKTPRGVLVGILCHFSVMPLVGFGLTRLLDFPPEVAAGVILIGSCSSGLASNVMAYLAGANLVLSVTVTAITTLVAPFMTPLLMKLLAGTLVEVHFQAMMLEIVKIVLIPIGAALLHDALKSASARSWRVVTALAFLAAGWLVFVACGGWTRLEASGSATLVLVCSLLGFVCAALLAGLLYHAATRRWPGLVRWMPVASMVGIVYFTTVTTAAGRDNLLRIGGLLFVASALHNGAGYFFGYWLSRGAGLDKNSARSVAFEVGLQNGGMASGLASSMGKIATVGLAPAIFSPWMNISGSILANYWKRKPSK